MPSNMTTPDCPACVAEYAAAGGCECMADDDCDDEPLIPEGCMMCGEAAVEYCFGNMTTPDLPNNMTTPDCPACVAEYAAAGGCECMADDDCDDEPLIPEGCMSCGEAAVQFCFGNMTTPDMANNMTTPDCPECVAEWAAAGGCECMA